MPTEEEQSLIDELDEEFGEEGMADVGARTGLEVLPKGAYGFIITNAYLNRSSGKGRKQLVAVCEVRETNAGDELIGKLYYKTWGLEKAENLEWLNGDLLNLDIAKPQNPKDLLRVAKELVGVGFQAALVDNKDPQFAPNCYINRGARRVDLEGKNASANGGETF